MTNIVVTFGRMNPPTIGHVLLCNKVIEIATNTKSEAAIFLSTTQDNNKNPLSPEVKLSFVKECYYSATVNDKVKNPLDVLIYFNGKYDNITFVCGSDRVEEYKTLFNKYNGIHYQYKTIIVVNAGDRDENNDASATLARKYALNNDFSSFRDIIMGDNESSKYRLFELIREASKHHGKRKPDSNL